MALFSNFKWYDWFTPSSIFKMTENLSNDLGISKFFAANSAKVEQQQALQHAEEREDSAVQRQVADYNAAGLNPALIGSSGLYGSSSAASQSAVYSQTQAQQAQAQQTQALASLLSSAAMLFLTKGRTASFVGGTGSSAKGVTNIAHAYYIRK